MAAQQAKRLELVRTEPQVEAASGRSFFTSNLPAGSELYQASREIDTYHEELGYPKLRVAGLPDTEVCSLSVGVDTQSRYAFLWQVLFRGDQGVALLDGRTTRYGDGWRYIKPYGQQGQWVEAAHLEDSGNMLKSFVLNAIQQAHLSEVSQEIMRKKAEEEPSLHLAPGNIVKHIIRPHKLKDGPPRVMSTLELPAWVQTNLQQKDVDVSVGQQH